MTHYRHYFSFGVLLKKLFILSRVEIVIIIKIFFQLSMLKTFT